MAATNTTILKYTPVEDIPKIYDEVKKSFLEGKTRPIAFRKKQINQLGLMIANHEKEWAQALAEDLQRPEAEAYLAEIFAMKLSASEAYKNVSSWAKPERKSTSLFFMATNPTVYKEPKGVVLVISPWNYPITLALEPVLGAIAAGNTVILKPAEASKSVSNLMTILFEKYLDQSCYRIINGAVEETTKILDLAFDHIFYTGSTKVGKLIAQAAAKNLTPCTLELGGKSPAVVFDDANIKVTARRLIWGKLVNAGQTCIAPDYLIVTSVSTRDKLIAAIKETLSEWYKSSSEIQSKDYSGIISDGHFSRLKSLLAETKGEILVEGSVDETSRKMGVTIVSCGVDDKLLEEEIFGPILPLITVGSKEEAVETMNRICITPLASYIFTNNSATKDYVFQRTRSGSFLHNDTLIQFLTPGLPFGGVGQSGHGNYHGRRSFDTFTYERATASVPPFIEPAMSSRYPPYSWGKVKFLGMFMSAHIPGTSIVKHPVTKENGHAEAANGHTNGHANGDAAVPAKTA